MRDEHGEPFPYRLITTDDPTRTLGQGEVRYFRTLVQAANAFVKDEPRSARSSTTTAARPASWTRTSSGSSRRSATCSATT